MRHLRRQHRLSISLMHELMQDPEKRLEKAASDENKSDLLTKALGPQKHLAAKRMLCIGATYEEAVGQRFGRRRL